MTRDFFDVPTLALATGKTRQAIHKQVAKIARGEASSFMGVGASAKLVSGRGGRNGLRYLLSFSEPLSPGLQAALTNHSKPVEFHSFWIAFS